MSALPLLTAHDVVVRFGARTVLDGVSITAAPCARVGLVGENGVGKSTLLRVLAGTLDPDSGAVHRPPDTGLLDQQLPFAGRDRVADVVAAAVRDATAAEARVATLAGRLADHPDDEAVAESYADALAAAEATQAWDAERRAGVVLDGLGLSGVDRERPLRTLSGGQVSRLGLAALLVARPRALLLDEPTNHLDDDAVAFVEKTLRALPGAVVLASHDRVLLDAVCTEVVDLDPTSAGPTRYGGTYGDYLVAKRAERDRWERAHQAQQEERAALRRSVAVTARRVAPDRPMRDNNKPAYDRHAGRVQGSVSSRVRDARRRLDVLERHEIRRPPDPLRFTGALTGSPGAGGDSAVGVRGLVVHGRVAVAWLAVAPTDRLLVTGANGSGKSSLLAVLAGRLTPDRGIVTRRRGVRVGLLEQEVAFADERRTAAEAHAAAVGDGPRGLVELGLLSGRDAGRPLAELSVGQRRRVALGVLLARPPDVLLLDEPTNHLSLTLVDELEDALGTAPGAVVVASHDRWLRRRWDGRTHHLVTAG